MKCKYCQAEMPEDGLFCPYCGRNHQQESEEIVTSAEEVEQILQEDGEVTLVVPEEEAQEPDGQVEELIESPQVQRLKKFAVFSGCIAVLVVLATVLFFGIRGGWDIGDKITAAVSDAYKTVVGWVIPRENDIFYRDNYSVSDKKAQKKREEVVATLGDSQLTNGQLQIYYWLQVIEYIDQYGYYLSYIGLDYTKPLHEQMSMDQETTWQQYFLENAIGTWQTNQAFAMMAAEAGYQLPENYRKQLDEMESSLQQTATKNGYATVEDMLHDQMGAGCDVEDYMAYMETYYTGYLYFGELYEKIDPTAEQIEQYFTKNEAAFAEQNIAKDSGLYYSIRHILVEIEGGTKGEDGKMTYTEEEWAACQTKAEALLEQWKAGAATEDSFIELVEENSADTNTNKTGGLYAGFVKGDMEKSFGEGFEQWCVAEDRKTGDYALLKTDYGYHLVYFVESQDIWYTEARAALIEEEGTKIVEDALEKYTLEVDYKKIVLGKVDL